MSRKINEQYIIIVGCGRLGAYLANSLSERKENSVVVIDRKDTAFQRLKTSFSGFMVEADAIESEVLKNAKIQKADVLVATTNDDNTNIMIAQIAKSLFNVNHVIARLIDPSRERVYSELGIETISPTALSAIEIERLILEKGV
ncbi:MAG: TrkA family potassium uptake protein [Clostridia bacterium]|nr:TrkA family potassium uptake protein [Clostridia bacterium]